MLSDIIGFIIIMLIFAVLVKFRVIRIVSKKGYKYKQSKHELNLTYKKFNGFDYYYFKFKQGKTITLTYDVEVQEGELKLELRDRKQLIWQEVFTENKQGSISAQTHYRRYSVKVEGKRTKGSCRIQFEEKDGKS
ncbi:hypothetical protein SFC02_16045 [Terribacillus goriensis]|uniref:hypothetical protein n=1 Tax=Terribacillus saccharophilus TaxID=361277 RepID=UPI0039837144